MKGSDDSKLVSLQKNYLEIIESVGEDASREGLVRTPQRAAKAMQFLTKGYNENPRSILEKALFKESYDEMVIVKDIDFYSLCEHHLLPVFGKVHVGYIPNGYIVGLSKIPRVVEVFSRRLQVQERMTIQIVNCLFDVVKPLGVAVVVEAYHMCMQMRGVQKQNSITTTSAFKGVFEEQETRHEFLKLISSNLH